MRDRKNRSGAGVDNRLNIKVIGQLPKLLVDLQTPDTMVQGEELVEAVLEITVVCFRRVEML